MREILFRGRTTAGKEWVSGFYAVFSATPFIGAHNSYGTMLWFEVNPKTIGQFTGLTDKNGKKIFEGDIWKFEECPKGVVLWDQEETRYVVEYMIGGSLHQNTLWKHHASKIEVIGNIHDNPELLEG